MTTYRMVGGTLGAKSVSLGDFDAWLDAQINGKGDTSEVYKYIAWAYRCVNLRANAVAAMPYVVTPVGVTEPVDSPWPLTRLLWNSEAALCTWGAFYWLKRANRVVIRDLQWLNPLTMSVERDEGGIKAFVQKVGTTEKVYQPQQIVYGRLWNPTDDLGPGTSPLDVALEAAGIARNINQWSSAFFEHGAIPTVILATDQSLPRGESDRIQAYWEKMVSGIRNAWKAVVTQGGLKPQVITPPVNTLALPELSQGVRSQIATALGVPQTLLEDAANYACLPAGQLVYTPDGPKRIETLRAGDTIWQAHNHGITSNVVDAIIPQGAAPVYEIRTPHRKLRASDNHPVLTVTVTPGRGPYEPQRASLAWKRTDQLQRGDLLVTVEELPDLGEHDVNGYPLTEQFMEFAGLYLGDGDGSERSGLRLAIPAGQLQDYYADVAERLFSYTSTVGEPGQGNNRQYGNGIFVKCRRKKYIFTVGSADAYRRMRELGLTGDARSKRVPTWVFRASLALRLAFLRGYLDADGTVGKDGRLAFGAANRDLIHDIRALAISCGIPVSNVTSDMGRMGNYGPIELYRFICGYAKYNRMVGSHDERYLERLAVESKGKDGRYIPGTTCNVWNYQLAQQFGIERVKSVECVGDFDVYDLATTGTHTFIAEGIVVHNTAVEHRQSFIIDTVSPECELIQEAVNEQLFKPLGLELEFRPQELDIMQTDEAERAASLQQLTGAGVPLKLAMEVLGYDLTEAQWLELEQAQEDKRAEQERQFELQKARFAQPVEVVEPSRNGREAGEAMRSELRLWQRKAEKRGKVVGFESDSIPFGVKALVTQRLSDDVDTAFAFLKAADYDAAEAALQKRIAKALRDAEDMVLAAIEAGEDVDYTLIAEQMKRALQPQLVSIATEQTLRNALMLGIDFDIAVINEAALAWAQQYTYDLVKGITETTRKVVSKAIAAFTETPGMTNADLRTMLQQTFGATRAEMIGTTEVTRAYAQATNIYQQMARESGIEMVRIWDTSGDDKVCSICGPLDRQPESVWSQQFPGGPPAHVNCRCGTHLELAKVKR